MVFYQNINFCFEKLLLFMILEKSLRSPKLTKTKAISFRARLILGLGLFNKEPLQLDNKCFYDELHFQF